jgi:hypothetical protein
MQFRVTVPRSGIEGGQIITVSANSAQFKVRVPKEVKPGDTFLFSLTEEQLASGAANEGKRKDVAAAAAVPEHTPVLEGTKAGSPPLLFNDYTDLSMALCLGCVIGFAIALGVVVGVLFVTEPIPKSVPFTEFMLPIVEGE